MPGQINGLSIKWADRSTAIPGWRVSPRSELLIRLHNDAEAVGFAYLESLKCFLQGLLLSVASTMPSTCVFPRMIYARHLRLPLGALPMRASYT
jgi:hypothetical protein